MTKHSTTRNIMLPVMGIIIAAVIFILPNHDNSTSYDDVRSIIVSSGADARVEITDSKDKAAFITWLADFVPEERIYFIESDETLIPGDAELSAVVESSADAENGGFMYLHAQDDMIFYNGTSYEATEQDIDNFRAFSEIGTEE